MKLALVTPRAVGTASGNGITADRWCGLLQSLGHRVDVLSELNGHHDGLIALHAVRSAPSIRSFDHSSERGPLIVALTGTDLDGDDQRDVYDDSLRRADALIVLQEKARERLPAALRPKCHVVHQSFVPPGPPEAHREDAFEVTHFAGLRAVKDPLRSALAVQLLASTSRVRVYAAGEVLDRDLEEAIQKEAGPRYTWLGTLSRADAWRWLTRSRLTLVTSRSEGGANVVSEAIIAGTPVLASRIDGNVGLLGAQYPGYFECEETAGLARLLTRCEEDAPFLTALTEAVVALRPAFQPDVERRALRDVLALATDAAATARATRRNPSDTPPPSGV